MIRPPRAPLKPSKLTSVGQCVTANPSRKSVRPGRLLQIAISRFSADYSGKSDSKTKNKGKSTQDSQANFCQYGIDDKKQSQERGRTSPKYGLENVQPNRVVGMRVGGFKIRHLSAHGRRSKQNMEPNLQRVQIDEQVQQVTLKQYISQPPQSQQITQLRSSILESHPLQLILPKISTRAQIMEIKAQKQSKTCIIISEYLIQSAESQLKKIPNPHNINIALRAHSTQQIAELQSAARESSNNINYLLLNSEKYVSTHNIINIKKLTNFENIISISDRSQFGMDVYTGISSAKYAYFALKSFEQLCKFMTNLNVVQDNLSQCGNNCAKIVYSQNFDNSNKTKEYFQSRQIREKIDLIRPQINTNERPSSSHIMKQFDEQFRPKMIQFAKLLHSESQKPNIQAQGQYQNQSQYMKIVLAKQISQIVDTSSTSTSTTPYQLVSELIRNNVFNCKQIAQFRAKWK